MSEGQLAAWGLLSGLGIAFFLPECFLQAMGPAGWLGVLLGTIPSLLFLLLAWPGSSAHLRALGAPRRAVDRILLLVAAAAAVASGLLHLLLLMAHLSGVGCAGDPADHGSPACPVERARPAGVCAPDDLARGGRLAVDCRP